MIPFALAPAAVWHMAGLLYLEESGIPFPAPGDSFLVYAGHHVVHHPPTPHWPLFLFAWLLATAAVVAGASNLYLAARLIGPRLARGRVGVLLHLSEARLEWAERAFRRWGPIALIVGRHVPGARIPITVAAGVLRVPYSLFALCVTVSTATWAAGWLLAGVVFGDAILRLIEQFRPYFLTGVAVLVVAFVGYMTCRLITVRPPPSTHGPVPPT
jgi:membrane protein DedA with SNARE-associated domain